MRISYSALNTYQTCPLKYKFQEVDHIKTPKSKEAVFGTLIHSTLKFVHTPSLLPSSLEQALEHFTANWNSDVFENELEERSAFSQGVDMIRKYFEKNDSRASNVVDLESRFQIEIGKDEDRHVVSGIIDRIDKTESGYEIIDYKTTRKMPSQEKVDDDLQLSVYLKAFLARYPKEIDRIQTLTVSLYYLKHGVKLSSTRTVEQLKNSEQLFLEVIKEIEAAKFEPIISPLCDWCGYQKICPMWRHKFKDQRKIDNDEIKETIQEYIDLKSAITATKSRFAELQEKILGYMNQEGVERVFGDGGIVTRSVKKTFGYDREKLRSILMPLDHWEDVLKVDGIALKKILPLLPAESRHEVESTKTVERESTSLTVKKGKNELGD